MLSEKYVRDNIKIYFQLEELVPMDVIKMFGDRAWRFLDYRLLCSLLLVRTGLGKPITANTPRLQQRGLRTNVQPLVMTKTDANIIYISPHLQGKAVDFDVKGMTAKEVRDWIVSNKSLFPFKIRLEADVTWVHMDVVWEEKNPKVYVFKA